MANFETNGDRAFFWQENTEEGVPEPALLVRSYNGGSIIGVQQEEKEVLLNTDSLESLIKCMRHVAKTGQLKK